VSRDTETATEQEGQLRLIPGGPRARRWTLDERTRQVGRAGVAEAREILRHARPPQPREHSFSKAS
jgi:hypothetical protein